TFEDKNVGTNKKVTVASVSLSGTDAGNYAVRLFGSTDGTTALAPGNITRRSLHVSATAANRVYDGSTSATVTLTDDRVAGDTLTQSFVLARFSDANVGTGKTVTVSSIAISGADAGNYTLANTNASTTADIAAKGLTVSGITAIDKAYDGTTTATLNTANAKLVGVVGNDAVSLVTSGATGAFADTKIGPGKTVQVSGLTLSGAAAGNYPLPQPTATANITKKALTVTGVTADDRVYDSGTGATIHTANAALAGVVGNESVTLGTADASGAFLSSTA